MAPHLLGEIGPLGKLRLAEPELHVEVSMLFRSTFLTFSSSVHKGIPHDLLHVQISMYRPHKDFCDCKNALFFLSDSANNGGRRETLMCFLVDYEINLFSLLVRDFPGLILTEPYKPTLQTNKPVTKIDKLT